MTFQKEISLKDLRRQSQYLTVAEGDFKLNQVLSSDTMRRNCNPVGAIYEGVKKLGTDPEIAKRLLQRLNL